MLVVVGGMQRSGSTFAFNVVRETLTEDGADAHCVSANDLEAAYAAYDHQKHVIVKSHHPDARLTAMINSGAAKCVCTYRKPEEAAASWMRAFGHDLEGAVGVVEDWLLWRAQDVRNATNLSYERLISSPVRAVLAIQHAIGRIRPLQALSLAKKYDRRSVAAQYNNMKPSETTVDMGFTFYDCKTFFHRNHVTALEAESALNDRDRANVRERLSKYVDANGGYSPARRRA
jgi:hypothetical protein